MRKFDNQDIKSKVDSRDSHSYEIGFSIAVREKTKQIKQVDTNIWDLDEDDTPDDQADGEHLLSLDVVAQFWGTPPKNSQTGDLAKYDCLLTFTKIYGSEPPLNSTGSNRPSDDRTNLAGLNVNRAHRSWAERFNASANRAGRFR